MKELEPDLEQRRAEGLYRKRRIIDSAQGVETRIDGNRLLSFCSNDYLGLANHPDIKQAFIDAVSEYGVGSGAAHLINGHSRLHEECEQRLAAFTGRERALLFSTGYMANIAIASALLGRHDFIYQDRLNHASLIDSAKLCNARLLRYRHNDLRQLEELLSESRRDRRRLIMTDGVFSMDGDCADLETLSRIAAEHGAWAMVDDAHGFGLVGQEGRGIVSHYDGSYDNIVYVGSMEKALVSLGGFVVLPREARDFVRYSCHTYIFCGQMPPSSLAISLAVFDILESFFADMTDDGVSIDEAIRLFYAALTYTIGFVLWEIPRVHLQPSGAYAEQWTGLTSQLDPETYPILTGPAVRTATTVADTPQFDWGLRRIIECN